MHQQTEASLLLMWLTIAGLFSPSAPCGQAQAPPTQHTQAPASAAAKPGVLKETVRGGIAFVPEKRSWMRITGKVKVLDAHTLLFEDGTEVDLNGGMEAKCLTFARGASKSSPSISRRVAGGRTWRVLR